MLTIGYSEYKYTVRSCIQHPSPVPGYGLRVDVLDDNSRVAAVLGVQDVFQRLGVDRLVGLGPFCFGRRAQLETQSAFAVVLDQL